MIDMSLLLFERIAKWSPTVWYQVGESMMKRAHLIAANRGDGSHFEGLKSDTKDDIALSMWKDWLTTKHSAMRKAKRGTGDAWMGELLASLTSGCDAYELHHQEEPAEDAELRDEPEQPVVEFARTVYTRIAGLDDSDSISKDDLVKAARVRARA